MNKRISLIELRPLKVRVYSPIFRRYIKTVSYFGQLYTGYCAIKLSVPELNGLIKYKIKNLRVNYE